MRQTQAEISDAIEHDGFCIVSDVLSAGDCSDIVDLLARGSSSQSRRGSAVYGARNLLSDPRIRAVARSSAIREVVEKIIGPSARAVCGLFGPAAS